MKSSLIFLLLILLALVCTSCGFGDRRRAKQVLPYADSMLTTQPDSALAALRTIVDPDALPRAQRMHYHLLLIQAKDKCNKDICDDTTIVAEARDYYLQKKNWEQAALAEFCYARAFDCCNDKRAALKAYLRAEKYAEHTKDNIRKGMVQNNIGWLYYQQDEYEKSKQHYYKAISYLATTANYKYRIVSLQGLSGCFVLMGRNDSAFYYYDKALAIAVTAGDTAMQSSCLHDMSVTYQQRGNFIEAKKYLEKAVALKSPKDYKAPLYFSYARLFRAQQQYDSAVVYVQKVLAMPKRDTSIDAAAYYLLSTIAASRGEHAQALGYYKKYVQIEAKIKAAAKEQSFAGIEEKLELAVMQQANQQLHIEKLRIIIFALVAIVVALLMAVWTYRKYAQHKVRLVGVEKRISELKSVAHALENEAKEREQQVKDKEMTIKSILQQRLDLIKKIGLLGENIPDSKKKEVVALLDQVNSLFDHTAEKDLWNVYYRIADEFYGGFFTAIRTQCPDLSATEFKIICLDILDFSNKEIALFLHISPHTVATDKTQVRRKLQIGEWGSFKVFFEEKLAETTGQNLRV